ncbi:MAG TPA: hypothetical protein PLW02_10940 [Verrucomicrobiota bacterium]|nr:hypothetical protein [Verrucomicrobiota bacterium]
MRRNKRLKTNVWQKPGAIVFVFFIALLGLGFVREKHSAQNLGREIELKERYLRELNQSNALLRKQIAFMKSPLSLQARAQELRLGLIQNQVNQTVRMYEFLGQPSITNSGIIFTNSSGEMAKKY